MEVKREKEIANPLSWDRRGVGGEGRKINKRVGWASGRETEDARMGGCEKRGRRDARQSLRRPRRPNVSGFHWSVISEHEIAINERNFPIANSLSPTVSNLTFFFPLSHYIVLCTILSEKSTWREIEINSFFCSFEKARFSHVAQWNGQIWKY